MLCIIYANTFTLTRLWFFFDIMGLNILKILSKPAGMLTKWLPLVRIGIASSWNTVIFLANEGVICRKCPMVTSLKSSTLTNPLTIASSSWSNMIWNIIPPARLMSTKLYSSGLYAPMRTNEMRGPLSFSGRGKRTEVLRITLSLYDFKEPKPRTYPMRNNLSSLSTSTLWPRKNSGYLVRNE